MAYDQPNDERTIFEQAQRLAERGVEHLDAAFDAEEDETQRSAAEQAMDCFKQSFDIMPDQPVLRYSQGCARMILADHVENLDQETELVERAIEDFLVAIEVDDDEQSRYVLARSYLRRGQLMDESESLACTDKAIANLSTIDVSQIEEDDFAAMVLHLHGMSCVNRAQQSADQDKFTYFEQGRARLSEACDRFPDDLMFRYNHALSLLDLGKCSNAEVDRHGYFDQSIEIHKQTLSEFGANAKEIDEENNTSFRYNYACLLALRGIPDLAVDELEKYLGENPEEIETVRNDSDFDSMRDHPGLVALLASH